MAQQGDQEKTEAPTPRRRAEARESGNIARSPDLTAAMMLLASILILYFLGRGVLGELKVALETLLTAAHATNPTRPDDVPATLAFAARALVAAGAPMVLAIGAVGLMVATGQVGVLFTLKPLQPKLSKLSPVKGAARLFDMRAMVRLGMSVLKVIIIGAVAFLIIWDDLPWLLHIAELELVSAFAASCELVYALGLKLAALLLVLALLDYSFQRWKHEQDLKMSKQDVKEEMKRMEGDPQIKQRRARIARQLALQRVSAAVPAADVIVTNPTHFAIALKYDSDAMRAPKVVAKGADYLAARIRQLAAVHGVPIVERKPLARALYYGVDVGKEIPPEHYAAVAEILAYVYRVGERQSA